MRGETEVGEATVSSLRRGKEVVSKIDKSQEGGIILTPALDFQVGDVVVSHS
jgi:translation initiation factor IF-2